MTHQCIHKVCNAEAEQGHTRVEPSIDLDAITHVPTLYSCTCERYQMERGERNLDNAVQTLLGQRCVVTEAVEVARQCIEYGVGGTAKGNEMVSMHQQDLPR